jgi:hypothetical protein
MTLQTPFFFKITFIISFCFIHFKCLCFQDVALVDFNHLEFLFPAEKKWKLVWSDEFNGPQPGEDTGCYRRTPKHIDHRDYGKTGSKDCPPETHPNLKDLNKCNWTVYGFNNYMTNTATVNKFDASQVKVENGHLILSAEWMGSESDYDCGREIEDASCPRNVNWTCECPIVSGGLHSRTTDMTTGFQKAFGRFEVRAKLPGGLG